MTGRSCAAGAVWLALLGCGHAATAAVPAPVAEALKRTLGADGAKAELREEAKPLGVTMVKAALPDAYPGTGVATLLLVGGVTYGRRGERDFAELVRGRGWLAQPPSADDYLELVDDALFDGMGTLDPSQPHTLRSVAGTLELSATRTLPAGRSHVRVRVGKTGKATVENVDPPAAARAPAHGGDLVAEGEHDLSEHDWFALQQLIPRLDATQDARARDFLARTTLASNPQVASDALGALPQTADGARALRRAWKSLAAPRRAALVQMANDLFGPEFAAQLKP